MSTTQQNIGGRYTKVNGYLDIENIVVVNNIPPIITPRYRVTEIRADFGKNGKILMNREILFSNSEFWKICERIGPKLDFFPNANFRKELVSTIKANIQTLDGTVDYIKRNVDNNWFSSLEANPVFGEIMHKFSPFTEGLNKLECFDLFYQILYFWGNYKQDIKKANKRTAYEEMKSKFIVNLDLLDTTWKNIQCVETDNKLIVQFPHADEISNGQRDILTLIVELLKFRSLIQENKKYILIIDEVFDYLDDANTIAAQYFLSKFLEISKDNLFLCMLTHLNPFSFRNYIFSDRKVNYVYLRATQPIATNAMKAFIAFREGLDKSDAGQSDLYNKLSHDLFHYNPISVDYSNQIATYKENADLKQSWGKTGVLHNMLIGEVNKYLDGNNNYDPYAVAMALRLRVEKIVYDKLETQEQKNAFVDEKMTKNKFKFAEENAVVIPDILNMINAIHNEADHLKYDAENQRYLEKAMVYKLQNNVIRSVIMQIFGWNGIALSTDTID